MIDLHCHILPGLDDGAQSTEEALMMARMAVREGITDIVCTPHTMDGFYLQEEAAVQEAVCRLQDEVDRAGLPLRLHGGMEVHLHRELWEHPQCLGAQGRYLLLELPPREIPAYTDDLLFELRLAGITPVIAHPERHSVLREHPRRLAAWVAEGVLSQVTAGSLTGVMGRRSQAAAERFVRHGLAHVIATDAHNTGRRRPALREACRRVADLAGQERLQLMLANAHAILLGNDLPADQTLCGWRKRFLIF